MFRMNVTYDLVVANNSHDTQWVHAMVLRVEGRRSSLIAEDNIRVDVGIKVLNTVLRDGIHEGGLALARGVIGAVAAGVVGSVAVNV